MTWSPGWHPARDGSAAALGFFVSIAEDGHSGKAAERLGMTQPPVSQGVQRCRRGRAGRGPADRRRA
ncbi:helix-turn-helix domain-containing protein [Kibdelosporangium phytohabitans]|uniref:helix-turn-helix domain-containing protein n=1 Tax=Kibdelosporangium phytohabitans TaxID=860235 RepID=UPI003AAB489F